MKNNINNQPFEALNRMSSVAYIARTALEWPSVICVHTMGAFNEV